jgi:hypothetical protein
MSPPARRRSCLEHAQKLEELGRSARLTLMILSRETVY